MQVRVAKQLSAALLTSSPPGAESLLIAKFTEWKSGLPSHHYWFSKDVKGDDGSLYHVHMIPENVPEDRKRWDDLWFNYPKRPWARRSDRYLLYADGGRHGYLLLDILDDPGAHDFWKPGARSQRENTEIVAENFAYLGVMP